MGGPAGVEPLVPARAELELLRSCAGGTVAMAEATLPSRSRSHGGVAGKGIV